MRRVIRLAGLTAAVALLAFLLVSVWPKPPAQAYHIAPSGRLRIDGGTIVNPETGALTPGQSVLMQGGRIVAVGPPSSMPDGGETARVDATGKYLVPGYNNMHVHVLTADNASAGLAMMLTEGVTGFRQMGGSPELLAARRNDTLPLTENAPALLATPGSLLMPMNTRTVAETLEEIRAQKAAGADFIKVGVTSPEVFYAALAEARRQGIPILGHMQEGVDPARASTGGYRSIEHLGPGDTVWIGCSRDEAALLVEASRHPVLKAPPVRIPSFIQGMFSGRVRKFLINPAASEEEVDVRRLQRAFDSYDDGKCRTLLTLFAKNQTWSVPTLVRLRTQYLADLPEYRRDAMIPYIPPQSFKEWTDVSDTFARLPASSLRTFRSGYRHALELTRLEAQMGVPMMAGTDGSGQAPGQALQQEFIELARAGLPPLKILQMTTTDPARYLGRTATMGSIAAGKNADLVILNANPLADVRNLGQIAGVVRAGYYHSASNLAALKARVAAGHGYLR